MAKAIREASGKALLCKYIASLTASGENRIDIPFSCITVTPGSDITGITNANPWLETRVRNGGGRGGEEVGLRQTPASFLALPFTTRSAWLYLSLS